MTQIQPIHAPTDLQPVRLSCRFEMMAVGAALSHEFCAFEFPGAGDVQMRFTVQGMRESRKTR